MEGKLTMAQVELRLATQEREIAMCKTRLAAEEMKFSDMKLELAKLMVDMENQKKEKEEAKQNKYHTLTPYIYTVQGVFCLYRELSDVYKLLVYIWLRYSENSYLTDCGSSLYLSCVMKNLKKYTGTLKDERGCEFHYTCFFTFVGFEYSQSGYEKRYVCTETQDTAKTLKELKSVLTNR